MTEPIAEQFAASESAARRADELRVQADTVEGQAYRRAEELRAEADALDVSTWPRRLVMTVDHDPEQVARVEALAIEAGAVVVSRREPVVYLDESGQRVTNSSVPVEQRTDELTPTAVFEIELAARANEVLATIVEKAVTLGLVRPE